jgi:hypothetical protein
MRASNAFAIHALPQSEQYCTLKSTDFPVGFGSEALPQMASSNVFPDLPESRFPEWQRLYEAALLEIDRVAMPLRIEAAEEAVINRRINLSFKDGHTAEREAIEEALKNLRILRNEPMV